jgi:PKD repeat protein
MRKRSLISLCLLVVAVLTSLFLPRAVHASALFLDEFNGSGELHQYNSNYNCLPGNYNGTPTCGSMYVQTDHLVAGFFDPRYYYAGVSSDNVCVSLDFNWTSGGDWTGLFLHAYPNFQPSEQIQFQIDRPGRLAGIDWEIQGGLNNINVVGEVAFDTSVTHTMKFCHDGVTLTGYLDNTLLGSATDTVDSGGYTGLTSQYYTGYLDNFRIDPVNSAPSVGPISVSPNPAQVNTAITAQAAFTDADTSDTHTARWDWGDGTTSPGTVTESNGSGSISDSHVYTATGVYTVTLTVTDNAGASGTSTFQYASVYNPTAQGLFSAGSHFSSPMGAYAQSPSLTGTVKFGLSYKYQGTMPVGDKQFVMNFQDANLLFNATSVSSLVIANGMATLTGSGTINGAGSYTFLVTGVDSGGIRIQITDPGNNNNVIYDTQPAAAATATPTTSVTGHVVVHN